jgi:hypothetical protein
MRKKLSREKIMQYLLVGGCVLLTGCGTIGLAQESVFESAYENTQEEEVNLYTSEVRGVLESIDGERGTITLYGTDRGEELTLSYDGATVVQDKYGSALVMSQLSPGEILSVQYSSDLQKAGTVMIAADVWTYENIQKFSVDEGKGVLQVGSNSYRISAQTKVFSGGKQIGLNEILSQDVLSLRGTGYDVASIVVESGHGYLKLENDEAVIGGWLEIGHVITQISPNMLITVPEGSYTATLSVNSINETREVSIERNRETVLDLSDIEVPQPVNGRVVFSIYPETASVYVDGTYVDTSYTVRLSFGLHQITASADGYDTVSQYFNVEGDTTTVKMNLGEATDTTVSGNSLTGESSHTITIQSPEGVEVYQDNLYMGIAPVTYTKSTGSHTITLRKEGYITRSYQIEVEDDDRDLVYSFPELTEGTDEDSSTVSGNTLSGNTVSDSDSTDETTVSGNTVSGNTTS